MELNFFAKEVINNSETLMNNINYYERKIHLIHAGEGNMMVFFNFTQRYAKLRAISATVDNVKVKQYWNQI